MFVTKLKNLTIVKKLKKESPHIAILYTSNQFFVQQIIGKLIKLYS